nr:reverse transcriptase domain-containing protein [Tanacetum cinerariifolium]
MMGGLLKRTLEDNIRTTPSGISGNVFGSTSGGKPEVNVETSLLGPLLSQRTKWKAIYQPPGSPQEGLTVVMGKEVGDADLKKPFKEARMVQEPPRREHRRMCRTQAAVHNQIFNKKGMLQRSNEITKIMKEFNENLVTFKERHRRHSKLTGPVGRREDRFHKGGYGDDRRRNEGRSTFNIRDILVPHRAQALYQASRDQGFPHLGGRLGRAAHHRGSHGRVLGSQGICGSRTIGRGDVRTLLQELESRYKVTAEKPPDGLGRLCMEREIKVQDINVKVDSKLMASQINESYVATSTNMIKYLVTKRECIAGFKSFTIQNISRNLNQKADILRIWPEDKYERRALRMKINQLGSEGGYEQAFASLFIQDVQSFTGIKLLNLGQLEKQLDKEEFQEDRSMAAFWVINKQLQMFIDSQFTWDYDYQITKNTIESENSNSEHAFNKLVNESSGIDTEKKDTSSSLRNYITYAMDADISPTNDQVPLANVQLTAQYNVLANEQQHTEQIKPIYDTYLLKKIDSNTTHDSTNMSHRGGEIDQDAE